MPCQDKPDCTDVQADLHFHLTHMSEDIYPTGGSYTLGDDFLFHWLIEPILASWKTGPSCSKLTTSLVNDSLKFTSSDTQIF